MKINAKLLLFTFSIVVIISVGSALAYFSLTNKIITNQNNQTVLNSTNDFIFAFQQLVENIEVDFRKLVNTHDNIENAKLEDYNLDFVFTLKNNTDIDFDNFNSTNRVNIRNRYLSLSQFLEDNPNVILKYQTIGEETYYFGKVITNGLLSEISEKIRAKISLVVNYTPSEYSSSELENAFLPVIFEAIKDLRFKNKFDIFSTTYKNSDIYATLYSPRYILTSDSKISFLIFESSIQAAEFRDTSGLISLILIITGIGLSLILVLLFTSQLRKQISELNYAAHITSKGNLSHRIKVKSKDEIGNLGNAFNRMLDDLERQKEAEKEYTEFITLINKNPTLNEISSAAMDKIINFTNVSFGILYQVEENEIIRPLASFGVKNRIIDERRHIDYYKNAIENKDSIEFKFTENHPVIRTGLADIKIEYILIVPIIYGGDVVAVIELASEHRPQRDIKSYLLNIREQLAVGIINGSSFEKLRKLVDDLKKLNEDYQTQNKELRQLHLELKNKADELDKERLKALESTKVKSQFLANMTHELKTPLNSILGLSDLIKNDESLTESNRNRLKVIVRNSKKLLNLINNILEFSRAEAGKISIKEEQFLLSHFIDEINSFIKPYAEDKGIKYIVEYDKRFSTLLSTDKGKLEQIIVNLLNNAVKFTEEGFIKLRITFPEDGNIQFDVIDSGIGISDENKEIIFDEFRQADGTTSRQYDGTGLGLSICKRYVELLEGKFSFESKIEHGSKFSVLLFDAVKERIKSGDKLEQDEESKNNILILSPSASAHKLYGDYFKLNNAETTSVFNYKEAETYLKDTIYDVLIINNELEDTSGWNVLAALRNENNRTPVIIKSLDEDKNYGYALAVYDYLNEDDGITVISTSLGKLKKKNGLKKLRLCNSSRKKSLNSDLAEEFDVIDDINYKSVEQFSFSLAKEKPDVLLVDLIDDNKTTIELVDEIKHNVETRGINILAFIPNRFSDGQISLLDDELKRVIFARKHHVLDLLKIFRQNLNLSENESLRSQLIKDDNDLSKGDSKIHTDFELNDIKVLVVDDDSDALFTVGEIIKNLGYVPVFAKNGVECLLTLNYIKPDLVLLDIMMPKMDGFETIKEIKKLENRKDVPVVALTAYAMLDDKDIIENNGFTDLITKPINSAELSLKIQKVLGVSV